MTVKAIVASSTLAITDNLALAVAGIMAEVDDDFAIRATNSGWIASDVEGLVIRLAGQLDKHVHVFKPTTGTGQKATYHRDNQMVAAVDGIYAFFPEDKVMEGGTSHVVEAALRDGVPVTAYSVATDGSIMEVGSDG